MARIHSIVCHRGHFIAPPYLLVFCTRTLSSFDSIVASSDFNFPSFRASHYSAPFLLARRPRSQASVGIADLWIHASTRLSHRLRITLDYVRLECARDEGHGMIDYYLLTKPGIIMGNLLTVAAGFLLASKGEFDYALFALTLGGITLVIASACVFNNYLDLSIDKKMKRTRRRSLALGRISPRSALLFGSFLGLAGFFTLSFTNGLTTLIALFGFLTYVVVYTVWKKQTIFGTAIGSVAGATPPVIGYCAVTGRFDGGALLLFLMMLLWQMPHFYAIALYHLDDYKAAGLPLLPVIKGSRTTKIHMLLYIVGFLLVSLLFTFAGYTGYLYLGTILIASLPWLMLSLKGFHATHDKHWSRKMFIFSLVTIVAACLVMPLDTLK